MRGKQARMRKHNRPLSHQIADTACAQISSLFSSHGCVVNPVLRDYGEDLVVQISQEDYLTPCTIYVQVKGTRNLDRWERGTYFSYGKLKQSTVSRWLQSNNIVMLVLWCINTQEGVYGFVPDLFEKPGLKSKPPRSFVSARIPKTSILNKASMNKLGVRALLRWNLIQCRMSEANWSMLKVGMATYDTAVEEAVNAGLNYLSILGILTQEGKSEDPSWRINSGFWSDFESLLDQRLQDRFQEQKWSPTEAFDEAFKDAILIVVVKRCAEKSGSGAEYSMLHAGTEVLEALLSDLMAKCKEKVMHLLESDPTLTRTTSDGPMRG
jgi:hypothetical protein